MAWISANFWPLLPALLGLAAIGVLAAGCGGWTSQTPWPLRSEGRPKGARAESPRRPDDAAAWVEATLRRRGLKFGTDGSVAALYSYAVARHERIDPRAARAGDLLFFDTSRDGNACGTHVGLVEAIAPGGALKFRERRDGRDLQSFADPMRPRRRRDAQGRVVNSFLRPRQPHDEDTSRYFAGEMVCAVVRVRS
ncbi:MAG: C40 family peptidase [Myxococcales bacterium]|nr:C40 family peptidase [Myxococcales bacterium]